MMAAEAAFTKSHILVAGRRDPRIYAIDFEAALPPENNATPNAIVSRSLVSPRRLDGVLLGDPANIVLSADQRTAYVMNHHGSIVNAEFLQHGGRANISIMTVGKMLSREFDDTDKALEKILDAGWFGGVGLIALADRLIASSSEGWLAVDGSNRISIIDIASGGLVGQIQLALTGPGTRQLNADCAAYPVPFKSPTAPATTYAFQGPSHDFGCWPNPQFIAIGRGSDGKRYLMSGNGGTHDVSIMDLDKALTGAPVVEVAPRIPIQAGPFGIAASPAVTSRQNNIAGTEGNTISLIDVDCARQGLPGAEAARVLVGADWPDRSTRQFFGRLDTRRSCGGRELPHEHCVCDRRARGAGGAKRCRGRADWARPFRRRAGAAEDRCCDTGRPVCRCNGW
jgi:hypothetical protein